MTTVGHRNASLKYRQYKAKLKVWNNRIKENNKKELSEQIEISVSVSPDRPLFLLQLYTVYVYS